MPATFIPEWGQSSARDLRIKSAFNALDDQHVVRRPIRAGHCAADYFIEDGLGRWLAIAVSRTEFTELDPAQLFKSEEAGRFEQRIAQLQGLLPAELGDAAISTVLAFVVVMWDCSDEEAQALSEAYMDRRTGRIVSREWFGQGCDDLVRRHATALAERQVQHLLGTYFPETEIPAVCTARRSCQRDNSARLSRFFLDREQEWASKLDLDMPKESADAAKDFSVRVVNGVAGSGKTLIAINRALLLSELFPQQRIVVLIHNTPIVADLLDRLHRVRGGLPPNLEVLTFFAWACAQWHSMFGQWPQMPKDPQAVHELVRHHRTRYPTLKLSDDQLVDELDFINEALVTDEASYLTVNRAGRRFALRPLERSQVWALFEAVTRNLGKAGLQQWSALTRVICQTSRQHHALQRYDHIIVDEAQFFAPSWFQAVRLSLAAGGQLFLCADPNQGFLRNRLSWKSVGLDVAKRIKKLRKSYRTTRAILESATRILALLERQDAEDYLEPDFTGMVEGAPPILAYVDSPQDAVERLVSEVGHLADAGGVPLSAFLVIYGDKALKQGLYSKLSHRFEKRNVWWFNEKSQKKQPPQGYGKDYLRLANLDTATGLEGRIVFLIGIENLFFRGEVVGLSAEEQAGRLEENARKLYMAMTRAGQKLVVVASQPLLSDMEALFSISR